MEMTDCVHYKACSRLIDMFMTQTKRDQAMALCNMNCLQYVPGYSRRISIMGENGHVPITLPDGYNLNWVNLEAQRDFEEYRYYAIKKTPDNKDIIRKAIALGIFRANVNIAELLDL